MPLKKESMSLNFLLPQSSPFISFCLPRRRIINLKVLTRLNEAHPKLKSGSFLEWRLRSGSEGAR